MPSNKDYLEFAKKIVIDAGDILLASQKNFKIVNYKDNQDIA